MIIKIKQNNNYLADLNDKSPMFTINFIK
jgi:hypothetical protein